MSDPQLCHSDETPMVLLGEHTAMPLPPLEQRSAYNVGEHRMVQVRYRDDDDPRWQCFDHGPACWTTNALRTVAHQRLYENPRSGLLF